MKLKDSIKFVKGIGEARAKLFEKLGIFCVEDMLMHLPRTLEDRSQVKPISELMDGETVCVRASLASGIKTYRTKGRVTITQTTVSDGENIMKVTWFNAPYILKTLGEGGEFTYFGRAIWRGNFFEMINPICERENGSKKTGKIMPVYPTTAGLGQTNLRNAAENILANLTEKPTGTLPPWICEERNLMSFWNAMCEVHMPTSAEKFEEARTRLAFEEFFLMQSGIRLMGSERKNYTATPIKNVKCISDFAKALPFELTNAQKRVINEISADLKKSIPMNRLIQGDVGSGKTIVAAAVMFAVANNGFQAIMMAPTEILASQHFKNLSNLFSPYGFETVYLSGSMSAADRRTALEKIKSGTAKIIVGTHALISDGVEYNNPALVITDEQHRFGVRQRTLLTEKGFGAHTLVMTATPIPRTLSLILYGDLDISVIDELPPGRKPIETYAVGEKMRKRVFDFVSQKIAEGRQAYIVCPLIEESEALEAKAVTEYAEKLKKSVFKNLRLEVLHGKLKATQRNEIMQSFHRGDIDILVSTTVIEVGVDVANASIMLIENVVRFGLSQLHQLRGRIGRGNHDSYCIMFTRGGDTALERMKIMCESNDGFKIAEKDLELRGPGEFLGVRQHGLPELKIANLGTDMALLALAKEYADRLFAFDPELALPENQPLLQKIRKRFSEISEKGILN